MDKSISTGISIIGQKWINRLLWICILVSFISVSCNTPETFKQVKELKYITLVFDFITGSVLGIEASSNILGCVKKKKKILQSRFLIFDGSMVVFIWVSFVVQVVEIIFDSQNFGNFPFGVVRIPRAFIMLRIFRYFSFQFESGRLTDIIVRAGHQIGGVTLFLLFFLLLYGLLGVQLFGSLNHCTINNSNISDVQLTSLAIPDTHCSPEDDQICPSNFQCKSLSLSIQERGYSVFDNIFVSIKTVYEAASQEGWVFLMYENIDSNKDYHSYIYFFTLIFFLAWLVKNVFIAVVIETFAEIRVQLHNVWGTSRHAHAVKNTQVISCESGCSSKWKVEDINKEYAKENALVKWRRALQSRWYHMIMMVVIVVNVGVTAFRPYDKTNIDNSKSLERWSFFGIAELFFTVIFDVEAILKVICLGCKGYFKRNINKYEFLLALMTTINTIGQPHPALRSLSVLRIIRLVKLSPTLESFLYKIFGPAKKIGMLFLFTLSILILMSTISLQMFCYVETLEHFSTFPKAFMSMFQIMTQEGWIDVMQEAMRQVGGKMYIPISIYFILYHLFITTVLISLFVAVILDNLELDENLKQFKQLKVNEQSVDLINPLRFRIFEYFPNRPEMISLSKFHGEFSLPPIRNSFLKQFCELNPVPIYSSIFQYASRNEFNSGSDFPLANNCFNTRSSNYRDRLLWRRSCSRLHDCNETKLKETVFPVFKYSIKPRAVRMLLQDCHEQATSESSASSQRGPIFDMHHLKQLELRSSNISRRPESSEAQRDSAEPGSTEALFDPKTQLDVDFKLIHLKRQQAMIKRQRQEQELRENHPLFDTPLLIIKRDCEFRRFCKAMVTAQHQKPKQDLRKHGPVAVLQELLGLVPYLDWLMILITVASCTSMMMESTTCRIHQYYSLQATEYLFAVSMGFELMMKVFANGLYFTPNPTFKGLGALLDLTTFLVSFIFVCSLTSNEHGSQVLHVLRCLRPLRIFKLVPQMKQVVVELLRSFKEIVMVGILLVALMFVFAIFGVQVYGGKLSSCNDVTIQTREKCEGTFIQKVWISNRLQIEGSEEPGFWVPRVWTNPRNFNFDTLGGAMLTLFEVLSLKGWVEVRDVIIARMGGIHAIYIHLFVFLGCMMGLTLFIGVVIANYNENKGTALLTVDQRRWEDLKSRLRIAQPLHLPKRPEGNGIRGKLYDLCESPHFKMGTACCVMIKSLLLSVKWDPGYEYVMYLVWTSISLTVVFVFEIMIKIIGMTLRGMMCSWRNRYDLLLTVMDVMWIFSYFVVSDKGFVYGAGWVLAALRFFSICGKHATLKMLLMTVAVSVYRSFFIIIAMVLLLLCYAFAGVVLFGNVKYGENIDRHANFATAPLAVTVLFRIVTGEDWNKIMHDCMVQPPQCTMSQHFWETDCGNVSAALVYFCSFYVIIAYIMLNLLVAIIVENFSLFYTMDDDILFGHSDLHMFQVAWNEIDERRKGTIPVRKVSRVLRKLRGRLFIDTKSDPFLLNHMCSEMKRLGRGSTTRNRNSTGSSHVNGGKTNDDDPYVTFHDVLMMTAYRSVDIRKSLQLEELLMREKLEAEIEAEVAVQTIRVWLKMCVLNMRKRPRSNQGECGEQRGSAPPVSYYSAVMSSATEKETPIDETPEIDQHDVIGREKQRRRGVSKVHLQPVPPFDGKLPSLMIEGTEYEEAEEPATSGLPESSSVTTLDNWWDHLLNNQNPP